MVLDYVGSGAAGILVGVMDPRLLDHVFPQIVDPHVHQLAGIQGAAAQMGLTRCVGCPAMEPV